MTNEELDKLEAALEIKKDDIFFLFDPANHAIYDAARAHLAAQRQSVNAGIPNVNGAVYGYLDKKALKANERERDLLAGLYFYLQECGYISAQRQAPAKTPLDYFSKNIDGRKTIEVFESACRAIKKADEATVSGDEVQHEIWFNIFKCESMRLMREYEEAPNIRAALTNSVPVEAVREAMATMRVIQDIFLHYGDLHQAKGTDEGNEKAFVNREHAAALGKALRELEPWVKGVE